MKMKKQLLPLMAGSLGLISHLTFAEFEHEFGINELERVVQSGEDAYAWSMGGTITKGVHSAVFQSEGGYAESNFDGHEILAFYGYSVSDETLIGVGWRGDRETDDERDWGLLSLATTLPSDIGLESFLYLDDGQTSLRVIIGKEFSLSESLSVVPEVQVHAFSDNEADLGIGSGLSDMEIAARVFYSVSDSMALYAGAGWGKVFGNTADLVKAEGDDTSASFGLFGLTVSF